MSNLAELSPIEGAYAIPIERIEPNPFQPRTVFPAAELSELAQSIEGFGVLQPIVVRPHPLRSNWFQLVSGERRWRASQMAGLDKIPAIVRELNNLESAEIALQENIQRQSLTDFEEAQGVKNLVVQWEKAGVEVSNRALARKLGVSQTFVSNCWKILGLPEEFLAIAKNKSGVKSSLFAINEVKDEAKRKKYLGMVKDNASFRDVTRQIERDEQEEALRKATTKAPDAETQGRQQSEKAGEASGMSRGQRRTGGATQAEARSEVLRAFNSLEAWLEHLSPDDHRKYVQPFARRMLRGDLAK